MFLGKIITIQLVKTWRINWNASGIKYGNTIKGGPNTLKFYDNDISDFYFYEYPTNKSLKASDIKIIYLGYYIRNWYGYINGKKQLRKVLK